MTGLHTHRASVADRASAAAVGLTAAFAAAATEQAARDLSARRYGNATC